MQLLSGPRRIRRVVWWSSLALLGLGAAVSAAVADYRPPDQRTVYDDWIRDLEDKHRPPSCAISHPMIRADFGDGATWPSH